MTEVLYASAVKDYQNKNNSQKVGRRLNTASEETGLKKSFNIVNGDIPYTDAKSLPSNYIVTHNSRSEIRHNGIIEKTTYETSRRTITEN